MPEPNETPDINKTSKISVLERIIFYLISLIVGVIGYLYIDLKNDVSSISETLTEMNLRVANIEGRFEAVTQSGSTAIPKETTRLHTNLIQKGDIKLKTIMTTGLEPDNDPLDARETFSRSRHKKLYVYSEWFDLIGKHRVTVVWISPNRKIYRKHSLDTEFKTSIWRTWQWMKMDNFMRPGTWFFEIYLDNIFLVGKQFEITL